MFFDVKILDAKGKVKKVVSSKQLSRKFWHEFQNNVTGSSTSDLFKKRGRKSRRADVDLNDPEANSSMYDE